MPGTIRNFFATIDPVSPPPEQPRDLALRPNRSHRDETFKLELLRWRRRVLPPGLPAVRSKFQRHRLATQRPYARSRRKDRLVWAVDRGLSVLERAKGIEPSYAAWEAAVLPLNYARLRHVIVIRNFSHAKIKCEFETILSRSLARPRLRFNGAERPSCEILSGRHAK